MATKRRSASSSSALQNRPPPPASRNRLLAALPPDEYRRLLPSLQTIPLKFKQVLQRHGDKVTTIYFPGGCVCSIVNVMADGRMIEVATVGNEGLIGITAFLGGDLPPGETFVQVPDGDGQAMSVAAFRKEIDRHGPFHDIVGRYAQALTSMIMQSTACNALHTVEKRCARWLLMTHDRIGTDEFRLTQEFLSIMLGVRRPTVTVVMGALHRRGIIDYGRRRTRVLNRKKLEAVSCECYRVVKGHFDRLLP